MAIPAILKGDTSGSIVLDIKAGYEYEGCTLAVVFNGVRKEFTGLVSGGAKSLQYTADETAGMPLGTAHATMTLTNAAGVVRSMPWVRIRVTDIPAEIYDRHIDVDPSQLDVEPAKAGDSLGEVKAKLNAVMAFLRGGAACLLACVGLASFGDIGPTTPLNDVPGDTTISNLVVKSGVSTGGGGGGITAQDATNAATAVVARDVPSWAKQAQPPAEADPTVPAWAKQADPPEAMADNALVLTNGAVKTKDGGSTISAAQVGAVETNAYWSVKKGGEGGIGVKLGTAGTYSTFYVGYNDFGEIQNGAHWQYTNGGYEDFFSGSVLRMLTGSQLWWLTGTKPWLQTATDFRIGGNSYGGGTQLTAWVDGRISGAVPAWARAADKPSYTAAEVGARPSSWTPTAAEVGAYPAADGQQLAGLVNTWEGYWGGTNVIFEVTNYYGNTSGEIPRLRIKELVQPDNEAPYWRIVWDDNDKFTVQYTNILAQVAKTNAACKAELEQWTHEQLAGKAPVAWGAVTDKGTTNVQPNSVWMTSPNTYFAGGTEYQRVAVGAGAIFVLTCNGATAYTAGQEGTFRFQDEGGTNYFGFAKTESYTIPCRTDDIKVEQQIVTLRYDVIMGGSEVPVIYYTPTFHPCAWVQLNNPDGTECPGAPYAVTWYTEGGSYYAALNVGTAPQGGFFKAETSAAGDVVFETNMKLRIDGGVLCTDGVTVIYPHANGTWSTTK